MKDKLCVSVWVVIRNKDLSVADSYYKHTDLLQATTLALLSLFKVISYICVITCNTPYRRHILKFEILRYIKSYLLKLILHFIEAPSHVVDLTCMNGRYAKLKAF